MGTYDPNFSIDDPDYNPFGGSSLPMPVNPMDVVTPVETPQQKKSREKNNASIMELANRAHEAAIAPKGTKLHVLVHGESAADAQRDEAWLQHRTSSEFLPGANPLEQASRFVGRTAVDTLTDPLTIFSIGIPGEAFAGRTVGGMALHQAERHTLPLALKVGAKLPPHVQKAFTAIHDLGVDSDVKRALAQTHGANWHKAYASMYRARNVIANKSHTIQRAFRTEFDDFLKANPDPKKLDEIYRAIDNGTVQKLPHDLQVQAHRYQTMTRAMEHLQGSAGLHHDLISRGYVNAPDGSSIHPPQTANTFNAGKLGESPLTPQHAPEYAQPFISQHPRGIQEVGQSRENYVAGMRQQKAPAAGEGTGATSQGRSQLSEHDVHLEQRGENVHYHDVDSANLATKHRIKTMAQSVAAHDVKNDSKYGITQNMLDDPTFKEFFTPTIVDETDLRRNFKIATDFGKAGVFLTPMGHMSRIAALAAIDDPVALAQAVYQMGSSYLKAAPKAAALKKSLLDVEHSMREDRMKNTLEHGAIQTQSVDRHSPFIEALKNPGEIPKQYKSEMMQKVGKALDAVAPYTTKPMAKIFEWSGHVLWHFDDEVKHAAFQRRVKAGMDPAEAAVDVGANLVDYANQSGLIKGISPVVPFSTWRTKMPLAVIRGMIKRPGLVSAGSRMEPAAFGGEQDGHTSGLPYADVAKMASDQTPGVSHPTLMGEAKWLRGSGSPWLRFLIGESADALDVKVNNRKHWVTGGEPAGRYLEEQLPILGNLIQWSGHGFYGDDPKDSLLQSATTIMHSGSKKDTPRPVPMVDTPSVNTSSSPQPQGYDPNYNPFK